ncbi:MAG: carboxymuconolactone decarboxylase family protein [Gammaproteobacteria bacterium]
MLAALPAFEKSDLFTPKEKAALKFAEMMAGNHLAIGDDFMNELKQHYSEREIMALGWRIAIFVGYGRLVYATGLESVGAMCPIEFRPKSASA